MINCYCIDIGVWVVKEGEVDFEKNVCMSEINCVKIEFGFKYWGKEW